mgnify:CR=1 FL=1
MAATSAIEMARKSATAAMGAPTLCGVGPVGGDDLAEARGRGLDVLGTVPLDDAVVEQAMSHLPAFRLADDAPAVRAIESILSTVVL